jgi:hypothetical protein
LWACKNQKLGDGTFEMKDDELRYEYEESGYFFTGCDFGCVHWEAK